MTTPIVVKTCDGGHYTCAPPKECCKQGCCYLLSPSVYRPPSIPNNTFFNPLFLGHWYFWLAVTATVAGILCACSLWRRHSQNTSACCRNSRRERQERASELDSNGSCYAPPQYSRCNSFHQAPPPYSEVTSKPDMYPLVISYNNDGIIKNNNNSSTGYLMVQYFRNFLVRPAGSLSATSTNDSISSSFICNAANEANTIIPPPYSCMGSLEEVTMENQQQRQLPHSVSNAEINEEEIAHSSNRQSVVIIRDNPCFGRNATINNATLMPNCLINNSISNNNVEITTNSCDLQFNNNNKMRKLINNKLNSQDSEISNGSDNNFSDLLDLSICVPSIITNPSMSVQSINNIITATGSDVSSLVNLNSTPNSPPQATSPTMEMRELLDKIQQLPQSPKIELQQKNRNYFHKIKSKTMYMPLMNNANDGPKLLSKLWRSAPNTPCSSNFIPNFPISNSNRNLNDECPLLKKHDEIDEDANKDEYL